MQAKTDIITKEEAVILRAAVSLCDQLEDRFNHAAWSEKTESGNLSSNMLGFICSAERFRSAGILLQGAVFAAEIHAEQDSLK